jgi:hypothetical protein
MVEKHFYITYRSRLLLIVGLFIGKYFGLGFSIDRFSANIEIGPFWFYIEW